MNRTEAKARAAELGISKDTVRQHGNLNKTQTWLDAISAHEHEAQMQIQEATEAQPVLGLPSAECELSAVDEPPMQIASEAIASNPTASNAIQEEACFAIAAIAFNQDAAEVSSAIATEQMDVDEIASDPIAPVESAPMFADPWDEEEISAALPKTLYSAESQPMYAVSDAAEASESAMPGLESTLQLPALEPSTAPSETTNSFAPVYPLLLLCVAVWALLWATVKLLIGLGLCLKLGLTYLVKQINSVMNERSEPAQQPEGSGIGVESVRSRSKLPKESPQPPRTAIP